MTAIKNLSKYEKQLLMEKKKMISSAQCRICNKPIGQKPFMTFEERYFHLNCLKPGDPVKCASNSRN